MPILINPLILELIYEVNFYILMVFKEGPEINDFINFQVSIILMGSK